MNSDVLYRNTTRVIDTAHIADDQVTLAKMAGLARGKLIYGDSSGNPAHWQWEVQIRY